MRVRRDLPSREIEHHGSHGFAHTRLGRGADWQASLVRLDGLIGGHEAAGRQLLVVVAGRVECRTHDERAELGVGEAAEWQEGEWHETRSLEPSTLVILEGAFA